MADGSSLTIFNFVSYYSTVCITVAVLTCVRYLRRKPYGIPGPWSIPFLGSPVAFFGDPEVVFTKLRQKYGDVFLVQFGPKPVVVVGGVKLIREGLLKPGNVLSDRPSSFFRDTLTKTKGLLASNGDFWKEQRTFTVSKLRHFGMDKVSIERRVLEEVTVCVDYLHGLKGQPVDLQQYLFNSMSNIVVSTVAGKRHEHDDPDFVKFRNAIQEIFKYLTPVVNIFPWLVYIPGDLFHHSTILKNMKTIVDFTTQLIEEHKNNLVPEVTKDFIDAYLHEMERTQMDTNSSFSEEQLKYLLADLSVGGSETSAATLYWGILYLALYPEVQRKLQDEIDSVVGKDRLTSIMDKSHLPYAEATVMEIQRIANVLSFYPPRETSEAIALGGFQIPAGMTVMFMAADLFFNPDIWTNPREFNPERFLDDGKVIRLEPFIPFSTGKRACPGEALAKTEMFLFLTTLMQRFTFKLPEGETTLPTDRIASFVISPLKYNIRAIPRQSN